MRKNIEISDEKINEFLEQFYSYFESGYAFEEFLKVYLEKIGLDEVVVTQRSSDGGVDLEAVRYGVGGFAGADAVDYFARFAEEYRLTDREQEVLRELLESDESVQDIAGKLYISRTALYKHISSLNEKTDTRSRIGLIQFYYAWRNR